MDCRGRLARKAHRISCPTIMHTVRNTVQNKNRYPKKPCYHVDHRPLFESCASPRLLSFAPEKRIMLNGLNIETNYGCLTKKRRQLAPTTAKCNSCRAARKNRLPCSAFLPQGFTGASNYLYAKLLKKEAAYDLYVRALHAEAPALDYSRAAKLPQGVHYDAPCYPDPVGYAACHHDAVRAA